MLKGLKKLGDAFADLDRGDVDVLVKTASGAEAGHLTKGDFKDFAGRGRDALGRPKKRWPIKKPVVEGADVPDGMTAAEAKLGRLLATYEDRGGGLRSAFDEWDKSGDGELSGAELLRGLRKLGDAFRDVDKGDVDALIKSAGKTHLDFSDFAEFADRAREKLGLDAERGFFLAPSRDARSFARRLRRPAAAPRRRTIRVPRPRPRRESGPSGPPPSRGGTASARVERVCS